MAAGRAWREPVEGICPILPKLYLAETLRPDKIGRLRAGYAKSAQLERASDRGVQTMHDRGPIVSTICIIGCREKTNLCRP